MKKTTSIRTVLGITQQDMAQLLGVGRSQLSMFELGKRDLPTEAKLLLAMLLKHLKDAETEASQLPQLAHQESEKRKRVELLLKKNEYQQYIVGKKMEAAAKKYKNNLTILKLTGFLADKVPPKHPHSKALLELVEAKATKALKENNPATLVDYELKQELLQLEKILLDSLLRKIAQSQA